MASPLVLALGDVHAPWTYWRTVEAFVARVAATKGRSNIHVVQLGDLYDMYSWSRFPRTQSLYTPLGEIKEGRKVTERLWDKIRRANPKAKMWQLRGNHDVRPYKRVLESMSEIEPMLGMDELWRFDGVETVLDERETLIIGKVGYTHGFTAMGGHIRYTGMHTVCGHLHLGGVVYVRQGRETFWEANAGFCANPHAVPLGYAPLRRYEKTTQGFLEIDGVNPRFIHLPNPKA